MSIKLPYGLSDFKRIKTENYYYIDKTSFIHKLEDAQDFLFFLRPRRFGKSLTISMLCAYYDIYFKDEFETIFNNTYILQHPTPLKHTFYIMRFDFSGIDITDYERSFKQDVLIKTKEFVQKYALDITLQNTHPMDDLKEIFNHCRDNNLPIYIMIDEYDNFVNKLLVENIDAYKGLVTTNDAFYKQFFTMLKVGTSDNNSAIRKMFFTGVSPVALYDVTSGSNIGVNISLEKAFHAMAGITKLELNDLIAFYNLSDKKEHIMARCDTWYDNYRFIPDVEDSLYNSDMILYYFNALILTQQEPNDLIDVNVRTDYSKLKHLVYSNKKLNGNFELLNQLITGQKIVTTKIKESFSAFELSNEENFKSFIFSLGFVTLEKYRIALKLKIPNQTLKKLLSEFIDYAYKDFDDYSMSIETLNNHLLDLAYEKNLSAFTYIGTVIQASSSLRDYIDGENFIKAYLLAYLNLNSFYTVTSEVESNKGYIDILLEPIQAEVPFGVIIELKYIKRSEFTPTLLNKKIAQASKQLQQYHLNSDRLGKHYLKVILVFKGWELVYVQEASK